jgi:histidine ammonia-lyase/phenylalanine ammonia-lyase
VKLDGHGLNASDLLAIAFRRRPVTIDIPDGALAGVDRSHSALMRLLESNIPVYGVTTGFGANGDRAIAPAQSERLQENLVAYLLCGSGPALPPEAARAVLAIRLNSLARGLSGVSGDLVRRLKLYLENDWLPVIPREGSLGASGDLIPLAYLAQAVQGHGQIATPDGVQPAGEVLARAGLEPYRLKAKEGLALVNGTSAMAGLFAVNLNHARFLLDWVCVNTSWLTLALRGRTEAFNELVNEKAKTSAGQAWTARHLRALLAAEDYHSKPLAQISIEDARTSDWIQDRYSVRCVPQICGPVRETLELLEGWLEEEINSASDNPLIGAEGELANGGNFYGGYLSQGMDYMKISLAHMADLADRQAAYIVDEKSNRGLPANLSAVLNGGDRHLHHGLKGLHQAISALTSEVMARATPGGIFSRSSESHNQDKVSLGMSAAVQCADLLESMFTIMTYQSVILAQALDLRAAVPRGPVASPIYERIRRVIPFVDKDTALGDSLRSLREEFKSLSAQRGGLL